MDKIWSVLGIEPTTDIKTIKRAYASKSKEWHPEEYPTEFESLQNAYKKAIQYAKNQQYSSEPMPVMQPEKEPEEALQKQVSEQYRSEIPYQEPLDIKVESFNYSHVESYESETERYQEKTTEIHRDKMSYQEIPDVKVEGFDYSDIENQEGEAEFWEQLHFFLCHPMLRKSYEHWNYFLNQPHIKEYMKDVKFRQRFRKRLAWENFLWEKSIVRFLNSYLKGFAQDVSAEEKLVLHQNTGLIAFCIQLFATAKKLDPTREEEKLFDAIWWKLSRKEREKPKEYLKRYFEYAEQNAERINEVHNEANRVRNSKPVLRSVLAFIIAVLLAFGLRCCRTQQYHLEQQKVLSPEINSEQFMEYLEKTDEELERRLDEIDPSIKENQEVMVILENLYHSDPQKFESTLETLKKELESKKEGSKEAE